MTSANAPSTPASHHGDALSDDALDTVSGGFPWLLPILLLDWLSPSRAD